jgi:hypothetical protein
MRAARVSLFNSIAKSKLTLLASPCCIMDTVCGSSWRHFGFGNRISHKNRANGLSNYYFTQSKNTLLELLN